MQSFISSRSFTIYLLAFLGALLILSGFIFLRSQAQAQVAPIYTLDHFRCYTASGKAINDLAFLRDQFGIRDKTFERDLVNRPEMFCNPTRKIHGETTTGISNFDNHLTWYRISSVVQEQFKPRTVTVWNQFVPNGQVLNVQRPVFLAVPTQKVTVDGQATEQGAPQDLDHFKCYQVDGKPLQPPASVSLWDQFTKSENGDAIKVLKPLYLCNPTNKAHFLGWGDDGTAQWNISRIQHPNDHLVCYLTNTASNSTKHAVGIDNQFDRQSIKTGHTNILCAPSEKRENDQPPTDNT